MLHQTLISSPSAALLFNVCSSNPSSPLRSKVNPTCTPCLVFQPEKETMDFCLFWGAKELEKEQKMETVATCNQAENFLFSEEMESWGLEKSCEGFSVEDLLDLNDFEDSNELETEEFTDQMDFNSNSSSYNPLPMPSFEDIALPSHDEAAELEWVSLIIDDSFSDIPQQTLPKITTAFTTPTVCAVSTEAPVPVRAKRSKRTRTTSSNTSTSSNSSSSSSVSSFLDFPQLPNTAKNKKRGRKPKPQPPAPAAPALGPLGSGASGERRCAHCGVQKTPQWRAGPLGAKTLCNACGVRYKSGRLLPEYRPACSPTFVSEVHSNSHRKVLEMRKKKEEFAGTPVFSF